MPPAVTLQDVKDATAADETLQSVARVRTNQRWHEVGKDPSQYQQIKQELSISNGVILRGTCIVVPEKLQSRMVMLAHSGHQGIVTRDRMVEPLEAVESSEPPPLRRSGRTRREPEYHKDYIT